MHGKARFLARHAGATKTTKMCARCRDCERVVRREASGLRAGPEKKTLAVVAAAAAATDAAVFLSSSISPFSSTLSLCFIPFPSHFLTFSRSSFFLSASPPPPPRYTYANTFIHVCALCSSFLLQPSSFSFPFPTILFSLSFALPRTLEYTTKRIKESIKLKTQL